MLAEWVDMSVAADAPPQERYVFKPSFGSSHHWALKTLGNCVEGRSVLDIGAGSGLIGIELARLGAKSLSAIEIDDEARNLLPAEYRERASSLNDLPRATYGAVLLLDVLEHMADPFEFMQEVAKIVAPGGVVLISVPNIAHWSVRLPLLFGRFEYASRGLLDRTHLQFFTRRRFLSLLKHANGLQVAELASSISPMELLLPEKVSQSTLFKGFARLRHLIANALPGLCAYQHLAVLRRT